MTETQTAASISKDIIDPKIAFIKFSMNVDIHNFLANGQVDPKRLANGKKDVALIKVSSNCQKELTAKLDKVVKRYEAFISSLQELKQDEYAHNQ